MSIVLVILYLMAGNVVLEQHPMANEAECMAKGQVIIEKLANDPKFQEGLFGACMPLKIQAIKK